MRQYPSQVKHEESHLIANVQRGEHGRIELVVEHPGKTKLEKGKKLGTPTYRPTINFEGCGWQIIK
jgi:hypothetical protein